MEEENKVKKYNTGDPIDINILSESERKAAFHEWAEGSKALEKLLNEGYKRGFFSFACCGGDSGHPYICYQLNDEHSKKMAMYVAQKLVKSNLDCRVSLENNFYESEEEYKKIREHLLKTFPDDFSEETYSKTRGITELNVQAKMENMEEVFDNMATFVNEAVLDRIELPRSEDEVPHKDFKIKENFISEIRKEVYSKGVVKLPENKPKRDGNCLDER